MKRNMMQEWSRAWTRAAGGRRAAWSQLTRVQVEETMRSQTAGVGGGSLRSMTALRSARPLRAGNTDARQDDLGRAILILQHNNKLLKARFDLEWPAATSVVLGESTRRNMSAASLARVLTAGLRRDAREGGRP
jgi:hypothetical protein